MSYKIKLTIEGGPCDGMKFGFDEPISCVIGRGEDCEIMIPSEISHGISKQHCQAHFTPPNYLTIRDAGSRNGTYLNRIDIRSPEARRQFADRLTEGSDTFLLRNEDELIIGEIALRVSIIDTLTPITTQMQKISIPKNGLAANRREKFFPSEISKTDVVHGPTEHDMGQPSSGMVPIARKPGEQTKMKVATIEASSEHRMFIENYTVVRLLGRGGTGLVYLVKNHETGEMEALKLLMPDMLVDEEIKGKFLGEIRLMRSLDHPNIVSLRESGFAQGSFYFTCEYCELGDLEMALIERKVNMSIEESIHLVLQCLNALEYAHNKNLIHRDIKPGNIFLRKGTNGSLKAKIGDFGVAMVLEKFGLKTSVGSIFATPEYIPRRPASYLRNAKTELDVWAMVATFYYMLTHKAPRVINRDNPMESLMEAPLIPIKKRNKGVPDRLAKFIDTALQDDKELRYQNVAQLRDALLSVI